MKLVFAVLVCLFFGLNIFAQTEKAEVGVEEISLARSDGKGGIGETADKFTTTDIPIYCAINLDSVKSVTVKMNLVAARANGLKPETKVVVVSYTTNGNQNQVNFDASPNGVWAAGDYRVDIFINGKLAKSQTFAIEKSAKETEKKESPPVKNFTTPRTSKKSRKN